MTGAELKHQTKLQEWAAQIQSCRSSGLPVRAWCRQEGINASTHYRWERELLIAAMAEGLKDCMHLVENARTAIRQAGLVPRFDPIRGGTDGGAGVTRRGLPCPNLGAGGHNFSGPYEHIVVEEMDYCTEILCNIVSLYSGASQ